DRDSALRRSSRRRDPDRRWSHLLPRAGAGPHRRALRHARGHAVLKAPVMSKASTSIADPKILWPAVGEAFLKLDPRKMIRNPVMFVVEVVATLTTILFIRDIAAGHGGLG